MGRGKIEIKRIENSSNRQVTYSKRRNGIMKKAKEITILCDAKVSLIIFGSSGKMHEYCSPSTNLVDILDQYQKTSGKKLWDAKHEAISLKAQNNNGCNRSQCKIYLVHDGSSRNLSNEIDRIKKENDNMQIELRHLKGEDITSLPYKELMAIEDALENGLTYVRGKQDIKAYQSLFSFSFVQMDVLDKTWKNTKFLEEDYKQLSFILNQQEVAYESAREQMDHGYQRARDYNSQMSSTFQVQPMQPNLQERM
ncbi:hypothetical protein E1A91_D01G223200v1 [Gossypium mustelinum]|uniref:MADS-box domain-containing protein n=1 Tax=Gossypium mustelinum TaxID=34275 RepID=A0A5D2WB00_GOSMU|nr:hypothetical protein E1A91_D01G223200v1 [Gossypium mustelinum]